MSHQHHGLVGRELGDASGDLRFGRKIHRAGGLVEQQQRRVVQQRPGQTHALTLTTRQRLASLAHRHVETSRVAVDEVRQPSQLGGGNHGPVIGVGHAEGDVFSQRAVKQRHILRHVTEVTPHVGRIDLAQVDAVEQHRAFGGLIQAHDEPLDGALA